MEREQQRRPTFLESLTAEERAAVLRAQLYETHKARGTLGIFYEMYPDLAPQRRSRDGDGGARDR
jgi:hypothetical protein